jgi:CDP-diacylglycerol--glycerol-3-phosphate 3-phosphatidyltransferase
MIRIVLIPVFLALLYINFPFSSYSAMAVFIIAGLTDIADGYIARRRGQETDFGRFLDPLADKVLVVAAMLWFVECGVMPAWAALIVIIREFMVTALRLIAVDSGRVIAAGILGKVKTVVTMVCLTAMFLPLLQWMIYVCLAAITTTTLISGIEYFVKNRDIISWKK